ncbi:MAG: hypothetical protein R3C52_07645 [Hyphomonadaceae bacterium]
MKSTQLTVSDPDLVAEFIRPDAFKAFFERRIEVPPDYMGLLMRNGQFVEAYKGAHFSVGGIFNQLKSIVGGSQSVSLLLADLKTFQVKSDFTALTKDKVEVAGCATIDLQINPERPQNIIGLMSGRKALSRADVAARIRDTLTDRVFEATISRMNAEEVRGNRGLQDLIQADTMKEIERVLGDLGVMIRHSSVEWALNDVEKAAIARAAAERSAEEAEYKFGQLRREMERQNETTEFQITSKFNQQKLELQSEHELERLVMDQEIDFVDARETGKRVQEMKVLQHEIELLKTERMFKFEQEIATATHQGVDMKVIEERKRKIERETQLLDKQHDLELRTLEDEYRRTRSVKDASTDASVAKTGFDVRKGEADTKAYETARSIETQIKADKAALDKLAGLNDLQSRQDKQRLEERIRESELRHRQEMDKAKLEAQREETRLQHGGRMTPEQTLAVNAGLSPKSRKSWRNKRRRGGGRQCRQRAGDGDHEADGRHGRPQRHPDRRAGQSAGADDRSKFGWRRRWRRRREGRRRERRSAGKRQHRRLPQMRSHKRSQGPLLRGLRRATSQVEGPEEGREHAGRPHTRGIGLPLLLPAGGDARRDVLRRVPVANPPVHGLRGMWWPARTGWALPGMCRPEAVSRRRRTTRREGRWRTRSAADVHERLARSPTGLCNRRMGSRGRWGTAQAKRGMGTPGSWRRQPALGSNRRTGASGTSALRSLFHGRHALPLARGSVRIPLQPATRH